MPIVQSHYSSKPWYLFSNHMETVIPSMFYKVQGVHYERERLELDDGDFLDLDWIKNNHNRLMIISHGLEGSSDRHYIRRPAKYFSQKGWDILAWNNRSCSGEMNRLPRFYHHGATEDLAAVVDHALPNYESIVFLGVSMGGGMQQKYLGEKKRHAKIKGAISFSVPCNVKDSADALNKPGNEFYQKRFVKKLKEKLKIKAAMMELAISDEEILSLKTFADIDEKYTIRTYDGYESVDDFYNKITSDQFLPNIQVPLLIVNAENDPMLGEKCYPRELASGSDHIYLEVPQFGGHVGFSIAGDENTYIEYRAERFLDEVITPFPEISAKQN